MPESHARQLDPSVLGESVGDDGRAGDDFPPDELMAADDVAIIAGGVIASDDVSTREARRTDEASAESAESTIGLVDPAAPDIPTRADTERQLVAEAAGDDRGAEAAAVRIDAELPRDD